MQKAVIILGLIPSWVVACGQSDPDPQGRVSSTWSSVVIGDQRANTFPTGTFFRGTGLRYIAHAGTRNHLVNVVSSPPPPPGEQATWSSPQIFSDDEVNDDGAVSIAQFNGKLYYAFNGADRQINIRSSADGFTWAKEVVSNATSPYAPMLVAHGGRLVVAFTGEGKGELNVFSSPDGNFHGDANLDDKHVLGQETEHAPALASFNGELYIGWTGTGAHDLNWQEVVNFGAGGTQDHVVVNETSDDGVGLLGLGDKFILSWRGSGNFDINYAALNVGQIAALTAQGGNVNLPAGTKVTTGDRSDHTPTFADFHSQGALLWTGTDSDHHVNVTENVFDKAVCDDVHQSQCLVQMLLVPMCWSGTQADFDAQVQQREDFLIQAANLSACPDRVRVITKKPPANGALRNRCNACTPAGLREDIVTDGLFTPEQLNQFQLVGGLILNSPCEPIEGQTNGTDTIWGAINISPLTPQEIDLGLENNAVVIPTHEWGHTRGLGEEYCSVARGASATNTICSGTNTPNGLRADLGCDETAVSTECCFGGYRDSSFGPPADPNLPCADPTQPIRCCRGNKNDLGGRCVMSHTAATGPRKFCESCLAQIAKTGISCASGAATVSPMWGGNFHITAQGQFFLVESSTGTGPLSLAPHAGPLSLGLSVPGGAQIAERRFDIRDAIRDYAPDTFTPDTVDIGIRIPLPPEIAANQPVRITVQNDAGQELSSGTLNGRPPTANAGADATFECNAVHQGTIMVNGSLSIDPDGDSLRFQWSSAAVTLAAPTAATSSGTAPLGSSTVSLTVSDGIFSSAPDTVQVTVVDTTPPVVTPPPAVTTAICGASQSIQVGTATATDVCQPEAVTISGQVISKNGVTLSPPLNVVGGQVTLEVGTYVIRWTATDGQNSASALQTVTLGTVVQAAGTFTVADRGVLSTAAGAPAAMYNSGGGTTQLGNDAHSGAIASVGAVRVLHRVIVTGDVRSATSVFHETDANISGAATVGPVTLPAIPALPSFSVPGGAETTVTGTLNLLPGSYASIKAAGGSTLVLSGGDYFFGGFTINPNVTLRAAATTRVFVKTTLALRSPFLDSTGQLQPVFIGFAGTATTLDASMAGTLLAPQATVTFHPNLTFIGGFRARNIDLRPQSTIVCQ